MEIIEGGFDEGLIARGGGKGPINGGGGGSGRRGAFRDGSTEEGSGCGFQHGLIFCNREAYCVGRYDSGPIRSQDFMTNDVAS